MRKRTAIGILTSLLLFAACKKEEPGGVVHGNITLRVQVLHHSWPIHHLPVYLEANSVTWPGRDSTLYDRVLQTRQDGTCDFTGLYPGNYYLYASGYDPTVDSLVIGYMPVQVLSADEDKIQEITLYVSE